MLSVSELESLLDSIQRWQGGVYTKSGKRSAGGIKL
jgi:hypothetical protein